jgi:hypothetical protein
MTKEQEFWDWFIVHDTEFFTFDPENGPARERLFDKLEVELHKVHPKLTFAFGPPNEATREFVISAAGLKSVFPAVVCLVDAAPRLERWCVIAFRPRRPLPCVLEIAGFEVSSEDVEFSLLHNRETVGIRLFIPGFQDQDSNWQQVGYLFLDEALGEFDVESRLGLIKMYPPEASTQEKRHPLSELPSAFDRLASRLAEKSRATSENPK